MKNDKPICEYNHLYLYAKGWYYKKGHLKELIKIVSHFVNVDEKYLDETNVLDHMLNALNEAPKSKKCMDTIIRRLAFKGLQDDKYTHNIHLIIDEILKHLREVKIKDFPYGIGGEYNLLLNIGYAKPCILPVNDRQKTHHARVRLKMYTHSENKSLSYDKMNQRLFKEDDL